MKQRLISLIIALALAMAMLAACGGGDPTTTDNPTPPPTGAGSDSEITADPVSATKNVSVIRIGTTYANTPFNTSNQDGAFGRMNYNSFVRLNLWRFDDEGRLTGDGCFFKSWEVSEDNTELVLNFDPLGELYWHDGVPVTIDDVVFTFNFYKDIKMTWFQRITAVEVLNGTSIKLIFDNEYAFSFMHQVTLMYSLMPKHIWEGVEDVNSFNEPAAAISCGPFRFVRNDPDAQISYYEAVENYPIGDISVDAVELKSYDSQASLMMAMTNDEIDVMFGYSASLDPTLLGMVDGAPSINRGESQNSATYQLIFGFNNYPTNDKDFRLAVRYALDYELFCNYLSGGYGSVALQGAVSPSVLGYDAALPANSQDIELSKKTLDDAGFVDVDGDGMRELPDGSTMNVMVALQGSNETYKRLAEILQTNLAAVGIRVTVDEETISNPDHMTKLRMEGTYELYLGMTTVGIASWTGITGYIAAITMTSSQRFGTYADPTYLAAYDAMTYSKSYDEYISAFKSAQRMNSDEAPGIALAITQTFYPYRTDRILGWENYPAWGVLHAGTWYNTYEMA